MGRPSKAADALNYHATKAELEARKSAEKAMLTGKPIRASQRVRESELAKKEFRRVLPLLTAIGRNDALYEAIINRYCLLAAECEEFQHMKDLTMEALEELDDDPNVCGAERWEMRIKLQRAAMDADNRVQQKRKMMFDIEKENAMTVAASLRSIPKTPAEKEDPLLEVLNGG